MYAYQLDHCTIRPRRASIAGNEDSRERGIRLKLRSLSLCDCFPYQIRRQVSSRLREHFSQPLAQSVRNRAVEGDETERELRRSKAEPM